MLSLCQAIGTEILSGTECFTGWILNVDFKFSSGNHYWLFHSVADVRRIRESEGSHTESHCYWSFPLELFWLSLAVKTTFRSLHNQLSNQLFLHKKFLKSQKSLCHRALGIFLMIRCFVVLIHRNRQIISIFLIENQSDTYEVLAGFSGSPLFLGCYGASLSSQ